MTCPMCRQMAPVSMEQLRNRQRNVELYGGVGVSPCPKCGGTEWLDSYEIIEEKLADQRTQYLLRRHGGRERFWLSCLLAWIIIVAIGAWLHYSVFAP
jgi:Zn-finger nucleic acid-binding protein